MLYNEVEDIREQLINANALIQGAQTFTQMQSALVILVDCLKIQNTLLRRVAWHVSTPES